MTESTERAAQCNCDLVTCWNFSSQALVRFVENIYTLSISYKYIMYTESHNALVLKEYKYIYYY